MNSFPRMTLLKNVVALLFTAGILGSAYVLYQQSLPCARVVTYQLGQIDPRFGGWEDIRALAVDHDDVGGREPTAQQGSLVGRAHDAVDRWCRNQVRSRAGSPHHAGDARTERPLVWRRNAHAAGHGREQAAGQLRPLARRWRVQSRPDRSRDETAGSSRSRSRSSRSPSRASAA